MKKLALLISSALLMSTQAFASNTQPFEISATVGSFCEFSVGANALESEDLIGSDNVVASKTAEITYQCNNPNGALISLTSTNGALRNSDIDEHIDYTVELDHSQYSNTTSPSYTTDGSNTAPNQSLISNAEITDYVKLAQGATVSTLTVTAIQEDVDTVTAKTYTDTLTLTIAEKTS